ncbi:MAG TPA: hypothetical protein VE866_07530 [Candidatus Binatia bacterium]|jgi:hypothetical protein|nr:hypothetical protein [Candidatus Binatia bacterium]
MNAQMEPWPKRFYERLHVFAHGESFDVDAFLAVSTLRPDYVWRRPHPLTSGIELMLGDGRKLRPAEQEQLAAAFLKEHRDELIVLRGFAGVDTLILGLVYICPVEATGTAVRPSPELVQQADEIGIVPIYYVTIDGR